MYVGMHKHARLGGSEIRCSEITSEGILGQKQRVLAIYMACGVLMYAFVSQLTSNFHERRYYGW